MENNTKTKNGNKKRNWKPLTRIPQHKTKNDEEQKVTETKTTAETKQKKEIISE